MDRQSRLDAAVANIQDRWGIKALHKLKNLIGVDAAPPIPTGFVELDTLLNGGIRVGCMTELIGKPTSGMATLALKLMASVHQSGDVVVYIDTNGTFDPDYALRCGVQPDQLLTALPQSAHEAVEILYDLVSQRGARLMVIGSTLPLLAEGALAKAMPRLRRRLSRSACAVLFLTPLMEAYPTTSPLPQDADLRLRVERQGWLNNGQDVHGYRVKVTVLKNKPLPPSGEALFDITFDGVVEGDAT